MVRPVGNVRVMSGREEGRTRAAADDEAASWPLSRPFWLEVAKSGLCAQSDGSRQRRTPSTARCTHHASVRTTTLPHDRARRGPGGAHAQGRTRAGQPGGPRVAGRVFWCRGGRSVRRQPVRRPAPAHTGETTPPMGLGFPSTQHARGASGRATPSDNATVGWAVRWAVR